jgi:hypothetical protein
MQWLLSLLSRLGYLAKVLWLCGYATAFILGGIAFFVVSAQGADFLRLLSEQRPLSFGTWPRTAFYVGVVLWSLASWYSSRLLAIRELPGFNLPSEASRAYRIWVPRVLGALPPAVVAAGFFTVSFSGGAGDLILPLRWQGFWFAVLAIVMFVFYWQRRELFPSLVHTPPPGAHLAALPPQSVWTVAAAIVGSFVLLFLFVLSPVAVPRFLGAPAIFVLAATSLVLFGSIVLTYMPLMWGYSGLTLPVVVFALLISGTNDNHRVREATPLPGQMDLADRSTAPKHFKEWLAIVQAETPAVGKGSDAAVCGGASAEGSSSAGDDRYPVFVVATAGGGIRAAYWTAVVLGTIADCVGMDTWRRHLYAVSGVSGGSLGAVVHAAEVVDGQPGAQADAAARARRALKDDHLSPVTAFLLFPDLLQRFLPLGFAWLDRARALEESWERSADASLGRGSLSRPFLALWPKTRIHSLPSLLLNSTRVETGQRAVISNLDLTEGFPDVVDVLATETGATPQDSYQLERLANIPVSTAAHLSARFTYVSPAARIERDKPPRALWGRLVDGGYFDNSGAATAGDLLDAIRTSDAGPSAPAGPSAGKKPVFVILIIKNDPHAPSAFATSVREPLQPPPRLFSELTAPVQALLEARDARGMLAEQNYISSVEAINADPQLARKQCVVEFTLAPLETPVAKKDVEERTAKFDDPPLGWSLSKLSIDAMEARLIEQADQFRRIRESIRLGTCVADSPAS